MNKLIYLLACLCITTSCGRKSVSSSTSDSIANEVNAEKLSVEPDFSAIIHPDLFKAIKEFTVQDFSDGYLNINIIDVIIGKRKDGHCYVVIGPTYCYSVEPLPMRDEFLESEYWYFFQPLNGHLIIDDKMVVFYIQGNCADGFVDTSKLLQGEPEGYMNNRDERSDDYDYDAKGREFRINREKMRLEEI